MRIITRDDYRLIVQSIEFEEDIKITTEYGIYAEVHVWGNGIVVVRSTEYHVYDARIPLLTIIGDVRECAGADGYATEVHWKRREEN